MGPLMEVQMSMKKKTAVSRSWILMDRSGKGTILDLDKYEIRRRVQIHARNLRILDPMLSYPSTILGTKKAIVLNLEHIKAIITTEEVLLRDPMDDNVAPLVEELRRRLPMTICQDEGEYDDRSELRIDVETDEQTEFPFEFRALDVALEGVCCFLDARTRELEMVAYPAFNELTSKISNRRLDRVHKLKNGMTRLTKRVQKVRDELEKLLKDDEDMADLYLTRNSTTATTISYYGGLNRCCNPPSGSTVSITNTKKGVKSRDKCDVQELEMMIEAYLVQIESTMNKLATLREYIGDLEDYINIQLDNQRNQLIQLELYLCCGAFSLSVYSLVAAIFGMNIPFISQEGGHANMFRWVVIITGIVCAFVFLSIISYARHKGLVGC